MLYTFLKRVIGPILKVIYQPWVRGQEHIPTSGPAILASNHLAVVDSLFLPLMIKREVVFMGKADYFNGKGIKGRIVSAFMRGVGTIPVDRSGGKASEAALRTGLNRLGEGELFGIYPEGTRSPTGHLYRGKTGVARLALESGAPVIPVAMIDTNVAQPIGKRIPRLHRVGVVIGEPLDFSRYRGLENDRFVLRAITDEIMYSLMMLSGQEYVDMYAAVVKKKLSESGEFSGPVPESAPGGRTRPELEVPLPPAAEENQTELCAQPSSSEKSIQLPKMQEKPYDSRSDKDRAALGVVIDFLSDVFKPFRSMLQKMKKNRDTVNDQ